MSTTKKIIDAASDALGGLKDSGSELAKGGFSVARDLFKKSMDLVGDAVDGTVSKFSKMREAYAKAEGGVLSKSWAALAELFKSEMEDNVNNQAAVVTEGASTSVDTAVESVVPNVFGLEAGSEFAPILSGAIDDEKSGKSIESFLKISSALDSGADVSLNADELYAFSGFGAAVMLRMKAKYKSPEDMAKGLKKLESALGSKFPFDKFADVLPTMTSKMPISDKVNFSVKLGVVEANSFGWMGSAPEAKKFADSMAPLKDFFKSSGKFDRKKLDGVIATIHSKLWHSTPEKDIEEVLYLVRDIKQKKGDKYLKIAKVSYKISDPDIKRLFKI